MTPLVTISIAMHVRCAACQSSIQVGALVDKARCTACGKVESLPPERWRGFLDAACNDGPDLPHPDAQLRFDEDEAWVIARAGQPKCAACHHDLPATAAHNGRVNGKCFCVSCGAKIGFRPVPPQFAAALPRITHLLGEDGTQLKSPDAPIADPSQIVSVRCPDCGGNIQPDGKSRAVRCPFCSVLVVLSQAIWKRLHTGQNEPHAFFLVHDRSIPKPLGRPDVKWSSLDQVVCDASGNVYGLGTDRDSPLDDKRIVFALDNRLQTKWVKRNVAVSDGGHIAWRNDGVLFVWSSDRYSAILVRAADGEDLGKLGGEQPKGLDRHVLDLSRAESLAIDHDGSILFSKLSRLVRCGPDGAGIFTWPPGQGLFGGLLGEKLHPFGEHGADGAEYIENAGDRPTLLRDVDIVIGWDGRAYFERGDHLACYDRSGKRVWKHSVEDAFGSVNGFGADHRGILYVLCSGQDSTSHIHRVMPDGTFGRFIDGNDPRTPIRDERRLAVHPDGTMFVAGSSHEFRIFSPDGRLLFKSAEAAEEDASHAERQAEERAADKAR